MTIALVTGANQGVGRAIVDQLRTTLGPDVTIYLTGRDQARVEKAAAEMPEATPLVLNVRDTDSVEAAAAVVRERHGGIDIVVSNAAARRPADRTDAEVIGEFVDTNNLGTTRMIRAFGPLLRPGGRFLIVASAFGSLRNLAATLHPLFDTATLSLDDIDKVMSDYASLVEAGRDQAAGWPVSINTTSKIGQVAAARIFAREQAGRLGAYIGAVCPGLVDTDASRPWFADMSLAQTPAEAAGHLVRLVVDPIDPRFVGQLVQHGQVIGWTEPDLNEPVQPEHS